MKVALPPDACSALRQGILDQVEWPTNFPSHLKDCFAYILSQLLAPMRDAVKHRLEPRVSMPSRQRGRSVAADEDEGGSEQEEAGHRASKAVPLEEKQETEFQGDLEDMNPTRSEADIEQRGQDSVDAAVARLEAFTKQAISVALEPLAVIARKSSAPAGNSPASPSSVAPAGSLAANIAGARRVAVERARSSSPTPKDVVVWAADLASSENMAWPLVQAGLQTGAIVH